VGADIILVADPKLFHVWLSPERWVMPESEGGQSWPQLPGVDEGAPDADVMDQKNCDGVWD